MSVVRNTILAAAILGVAVPAQAEDWAVSRIQYINEGTYDAAFTATVLGFDGARSSCDEKSSKSESVGAGQSVTIRIGKEDGTRSEMCPALPGYEVWGTVSVVTNLLPKTYSEKNCRKDKARFFFHPDGGTLKVVTQGSTQNNNRCKVRARGGVKWNTDVHGKTVYQD